MQSQGELNFDGASAEGGFSEWIVVRKLAADDAARKLNLPIGCEAEVWLRNGIRLQGKLRLSNELLFVEEKQIRTLPLIIDGVSFSFAEMESCVRLD